MKNQLLKGTLILSVAGIITRIIGFVYRIFLVDILGETSLGIYQLIFPVYSLCFTLYAAGIQTAVSQMISFEAKEKHPGIIKTALLLSLFVAAFLSIIVYSQAAFIANTFLGTKETIPLLKVLSLIFPFCGITSVINGYFYGISNAKVPAFTQIIEQLCRVFFVFIMATFIYNKTASPTLAVIGILIGELASNLYNIVKLFSHIPFTIVMKGNLQLRRLLSLSLPLCGNKLVIASLGSVESVLIPVMLCKFGYSYGDSLAVFGVLTGVVLPFIMFPGTLTNSLSVLLLPTISQAAGKQQNHLVRHTTDTTVRYSILLGVVASALFLNFGIPMGTVIFNSVNAGKLLTALSFLCPFLYVSTTLNSVINGLGKTGITFLHTVISLSVRIFFLVVLTPNYGIYGYLLGLIISQIVICILNSIYLIKKIQLTLQICNHLVWPSIFANSIFYFAKIAGVWLESQTKQPLFAYVFVIPAMIILIIYLYFSRLIDKKIMNS